VAARAPRAAALASRTVLLQRVGGLEAPSLYPKYEDAKHGVESKANTTERIFTCVKDRGELTTAAIFYPRLKNPLTLDASRR
jgi:hypothetical protein